MMRAVFPHRFPMPQHLYGPHLGAGPNWAEIVTAIATGLLALAGIGALLQIGEARRSRHTEAAARMSSRWETEPYVAARTQIDLYQDNMELRDKLLMFMAARSPERHPLLRELSFFEELGAMEKMGATSLRWIDETMKDLVLARWRVWEPTIDELNRGVDSEHQSYKNFRLLVSMLNGENQTRRQRLKRRLARYLSY